VRELATEQAGDELFGLPPEEFVAARDELARRLRRQGDAEAARRVKALRRPPLSAWAVNQLARGERPALEALLATGERLRAAQREALTGGDADELRAAARAEREAVAGLVTAALARLREAGHPASDATRDRVAATLHAAAASPEAADLVRHGRLTADLDPAGFGAVPDEGAAPAEGAGEAAAAGAGGQRPRRGGAGTGPGRGRGRGAARAGREAGAGPGAGATPAGGDAGATVGGDRPGAVEDGDRRAAAEDEAAARRARRAAAVAARDDARRRARLAADQAVLATRHAERLGRLADQAEREARRARATAAAAIEAASAARERAARAARELREAEKRIPADH
jgi:hypothetical protein